MKLKQLAIAAAVSLATSPLVSPVAQDIKPRLIRFGYGLNEMSQPGPRRQGVRRRSREGLRAAR